MSKIFFVLLFSAILSTACSSDKKEAQAAEASTSISEKQALPDKKGPPQLRELLTQEASGYFEFTLKGKKYRAESFLAGSSLIYSDNGPVTPRITMNINGEGDPVGLGMQFSLNNFKSEGRKNVTGKFPISTSGREQFAGFLMTIPEALSVSQTLNINLENGTADIIELTDQGHIKLDFSGDAKFSYVSIETQKAVIDYGKINGSIELQTELVQSFE